MASSVAPKLEERFLTWFAKRRWSESDYLLFANDQNALIDLIDGKVVLHETPTPRHQSIVVALTLAFGRSRVGQVLVAPMPVRLRTDRMREPDVMFYRTEHMDRIHDQYGDPPDLVAEVLSPSTRNVDEVDKLAEYAAAGIPEYWVIDADEGIIDVYVMAGRCYAPPKRFARGSTISPGPAPDVSVEVVEVVGDATR